jgi:hypothetical protein
LDKDAALAVKVLPMLTNGYWRDAGLSGGGGAVLVARREREKKKEEMRQRILVPSPVKPYRPNVEMQKRRYSLRLSLLRLRKRVGR